MNRKMKRRLAVVSGVVVVVVIVVAAIVAGGQAARSITIAQALSGDYTSQKVQVTGNVVTGSFSLTSDSAAFWLYDEEADEDAEHPLQVVYHGSVSATFGNGVQAIATGRLDDHGVLQATELVTKCPSKYESGTDALTVAQLIGYGDQVIDKPVKVRAQVVGSLALPGAALRFQVADDASSTPTLGVNFDGALPDVFASGSEVVLTGSIAVDGVFYATDVALEG